MRINNKKIYNFIIITVFAVGFLMRLVLLGKVPGGDLNQDEAFGGYEAYSLLKYHHDSRGFFYPVYLTVWGSGMSALMSYLEIPVISILGLSKLSVRLPQAVIGCLTLVLYYLFCKEEGRFFSILAVFLLAISPWHIMMSRWGLDCNLLPFFLLASTYCMRKAVKNRRYLLLSGFMYGLCLYCYASAWILMPFFILVTFIINYRDEKIPERKYIFSAVLILLFMALPLLLFVLINLHLFPQISTKFISIPRLPAFRNGEFHMSIYGIVNNLKSLFRWLILQNDDLISNSTKEFGIYYHFSIVFIIAGILSVSERIKKHSATKNEMIMMMFPVLALIHGMLINSNVNKMNFVHIPIVYFCAKGIQAVYKKTSRKILYCCAALYTAAFLMFSVFYFTDYNELWSKKYGTGLLEVSEFIRTLQYENVKVCWGIWDSRYALLMNYFEIPTDEFVKTVVFDDLSNPFQHPVSFGKFEFCDEVPTPVSSKSIYILDDEREEMRAAMQESGLSEYCVGDYSVFYIK